MKTVKSDDLKKLYIPPSDSHKGQNGRLLIIGGSKLFHAASLWSLEVASRIVDLVHYSSVEENNKIVHELKKEFRSGIVIPRDEIESYIEEDDAILIGPGMMRVSSNIKYQISNQIQISNIKDINKIKEEGFLTGVLTNYLLQKYPQKRWVIDAGALQMVDPRLIPKESILTPHRMEFENLEHNCYIAKLLYCYKKDVPIEERIKCVSQSLGSYVLLKGQKDIAAGPDGEMREIVGGNAGMTKGGTGDVLAGLIAALACKNDPFLATTAGSYINKKAGDELYKKMGPFFNASDLAGQIPMTMEKLI